MSNRSEGKPQIQGAESELNVSNDVLNSFELPNTDFDLPSLPPTDREERIHATVPPPAEPAAELQATDYYHQQPPNEEKDRLQLNDQFTPRDAFVPPAGVPRLDFSPIHAEREREFKEQYPTQNNNDANLQHIDQPHNTAAPPLHTTVGSLPSPTSISTGRPGGDPHKFFVKQRTRFHINQEKNERVAMKPYYHQLDSVTNRDAPPRPEVMEDWELELEGELIRSSELPNECLMLDNEFKLRGEFKSSHEKTHFVYAIQLKAFEPALVDTIEMRNHMEEQDDLEEYDKQVTRKRRFYMVFNALKNVLRGKIDPKTGEGIYGDGSQYLGYITRGKYDPEHSYIQVGASLQQLEQMAEIEKVQLPGLHEDFHVFDSELKGKRNRFAHPQGRVCPSLIDAVIAFRKTQAKFIEEDLKVYKEIDRLFSLEKPPPIGTPDADTRPVEVRKKEYRERHFRDRIEQMIEEGRAGKDLLGIKPNFPSKDDKLNKSSEHGKVNKKPPTVVAPEPKRIGPDSSRPSARPHINRKASHAALKLDENVTLPDGLVLPDCDCNLFVPCQQEELVRKLIEKALDNVLSQLDNEKATAGNGLRELKRRKVIKDIFPLHYDVDPRFYRLSRQEVVNKFCSMRTSYKSAFSCLQASETYISWVRDYFGEKIGMYFAFLHFYNYSTVYLAALGLIPAIWQYSTGSDNASVVVYCVVIMLWAAFFVKFWNRQSNDFAFEWNMLEYEQNEGEMDSFLRSLQGPDGAGNSSYGFYEREGRWVDMRTFAAEAKAEEREAILRFVPKNHIDSSGRCHPCFYKCWYPNKSSTIERMQLNANMWRYFKESLGWSVISTLIGCVLSATVSLILLRLFLTKIWQTYGQVAAGVANGVTIFVLDKLYKEAAIKMTEWENHRTVTQFEEKLTSKAFVFQFVNSYFSLFYIAFFKSSVVLDMCANPTGDLIAICSNAIAVGVSPLDLNTPLGCKNSDSSILAVCLKSTVSDSLLGFQDLCKTSSGHPAQTCMDELSSALMTIILTRLAIALVMQRILPRYLTWLSLKRLEWNAQLKNKVKKGYKETKNLGKNVGEGVFAVGKGMGRGMLLVGKGMGKGVVTAFSPFTEKLRLTDSMKKKGITVEQLQQEADRAEQEAKILEEGAKNRAPSPRNFRSDVDLTVDAPDIGGKVAIRPIQSPSEANFELNTPHKLETRDLEAPIELGPPVTPTPTTFKKLHTLHAPPPPPPGPPGIPIPSTTNAIVAADAKNDDDPENNPGEPELSERSVVDDDNAETNEATASKKNSKNALEAAGGTLLQGAGAVINVADNVLGFGNEVFSGGINLLTGAIDRISFLKDMDKLSLEYQSIQPKYAINKNVLGTFDDYNELVIGYGYMVMFAAAFPICPLITMGHNVIQSSTHGFKLIKNFQKPPYFGATDIGMFWYLLVFLTAMSVVTNTAIVCYTSSQLDHYLDHPTATTRVITAIVLEHIFGFAVYAVLANLSDFRPSLRVRLAYNTEVKEIENDFQEHLKMKKSQAEKKEFEKERQELARKESMVLLRMKSYGQEIQPSREGTQRPLLASVSGRGPAPQLPSLKPGRGPEPTASELALALMSNEERRDFEEFRRLKKEKAEKAKADKWAKDNPTPAPIEPPKAEGEKKSEKEAEPKKPEPEVIIVTPPPMELPAPASKPEVRITTVPEPDSDSDSADPDFDINWDGLSLPDTSTRLRRVNLFDPNTRELKTVYTQKTGNMDVWFPFEVKKVTELNGTRISHPIVIGKQTYRLVVAKSVDSESIQLTLRYESGPLPHFCLAILAAKLYNAESIGLYRTLPHMFQSYSGFGFPHFASLSELRTFGCYKPKKDTLTFGLIIPSSNWMGNVRSPRSPPVGVPPRHEGEEVFVGEIPQSFPRLLSSERASQPLEDRFGGEHYPRWKDNEDAPLLDGGDEDDDGEEQKGEEEAASAKAKASPAVEEQPQPKKNKGAHLAPLTMGLRTPLPTVYDPKALGPNGQPLFLQPILQQPQQHQQQQVMQLPNQRSPLRSVPLSAADAGLVHVTLPTPYQNDDPHAFAAAGGPSARLAPNLWSTRSQASVASAPPGAALYPASAASPMRGGGGGNASSRRVADYPASMYAPNSPMSPAYYSGQGKYDSVFAAHPPSAQQQPPRSSRDSYGLPAQPVLSPLPPTRAQAPPPQAWQQQQQQHQQQQQQQPQRPVVRPAQFGMIRDPREEFASLYQPPNPQQQYALQQQRQMQQWRQDGNLVEVRAAPQLPNQPNPFNPTMPGPGPPRSGW